MGQNFLDLAVERMQTKDEKMKRICLENSCEVAEYNLLKTVDLNYF